MIPESKITELWAAARKSPTPDRVPYAFENRVMAALQSSAIENPVGAAVAGLWRAALLSAAVALMATGLDFAVLDPVVESDVEESLELAVLPVDDAELEL